VVYASPLYMWSLSAQLKPFLDRTLCLVKDYGGPNYKSFVDGKKATLLMTCAGPIEGNTDWARGQFVQYAEYQRYDLIEPWFIPGCSTPDRLGEDVRQSAGKLVAKLLG
jgi:multimeric flavodoxin WrbA